MEIFFFFVMLSSREFLFFLCRVVSAVAFCTVCVAVACGLVAVISPR